MSAVKDRAGQCFALLFLEPSSHDSWQQCVVTDVCFSPNTMKKWCKVIQHHRKSSEIVQNFLE